MSMSPEIGEQIVTPKTPEGRVAERLWIDWARANYPADHIGAAIAQLDRIATALEKLVQRAGPDSGGAHQP